MNILEAYISLQNLKTQAWVDVDPANRWAGFGIADAAHWAEDGIYTPKQYERYMAIASVADAHKEAFGFRDRSVNLNTMTDVELDSYCEYVYEALDAEMERAEAQQKLDIAEFEKLVLETIAMGAGDRATAYRWLDIDTESRHDSGRAEYDYGLPYGYIQESVK